MMDNKKAGGVFIVVFLLIGLFIASIMFLMFIPVVSPLIDAARGSGNISAIPAAMSTIARIELVWYGIPILVFIILIVWAIASATRKDPYDYEY